MCNIAKLTTMCVIVGEFQVAERARCPIQITRQKVEMRKKDLSCLLQVPIGNVKESGLMLGGTRHKQGHIYICSRCHGFLLYFGFQCYIVNVTDVHDTRCHWGAKPYTYLVTPNKISQHILNGS